MPHFFFDTYDGEDLIRDREGQNLLDRETARRGAIAGLPDMAQDKLPDGDRRDFYVNVRDESGHVIYTACLSLVGRWLD